MIIQGSQHIGKKHDVGPDSAFYSLCDLGQVISPVERSVSSPVKCHLYGAIVDTGKMVVVVWEVPACAQNTTNLKNRTYHY